MARTIDVDLTNIIGDTPCIDDVKIGVALSGGRDSIALVHCLKEKGYKVVAINVEHGIRGEKSVSDSNFVKEFCKQQNVPCFCYSVQAVEYANQNGYTIEQSARILRYQIFEKVLEEKKCDYIAIAHHLDDQAETILMRILRGTGIKGLVGMKSKSGKYIRPLLNCTREDINAYIEANHLEYVDDETNLDTAYTRNFLREELDTLKKKYPCLLSSFARLSAIAEETEDYLDTQTPKVRMAGGEVFVEIDYALHSCIEKRTYFKAINMLGVNADIENRHYELINTLKTSQNGKRIELPHGVIAHKQDEYIVFSKEEEQLRLAKMDFSLDNLAWLGIESEIVPIEQFEKSDGMLYFDADKVACGAVLRNRLEGDFIEKFGGGTKSLGDFLTDKKIPLRDRDKLVLLANDSEVLVVFSLEISKKVAIDDTTKRVCVVKKQL